MDPNLYVSMDPNLYEVNEPEVLRTNSLEYSSFSGESLAKAVGTHP